MRGLKVKLTAILLSAVMFVMAEPAALWKASADGIAEATRNVQVQAYGDVQTENADTEQTEETPYIVTENVKNRQPRSKEFIMSDGTITVQHFAENVHYAENGEYKEIDNGITESEDGESYENIANSFKVKLNKAYSAINGIAEISDGEYGLSFDLVKKEQSFKEKVTEGLNKIREFFDYAGKKLTSPQEFINNVGKLKYYGIQKNVDIEYEITNNGLKENVIINKLRDGYEFGFKVYAKNLTLTLLGDGSISAENADGEIKFIIPAPFMTDADGRRSDDVYYTLVKADGYYILTVTADTEWINNIATLPVKIDPIIEDASQGSFSFTNVYQDGTKVSSGTDVFVGRKGGNTSNAYFQFYIPLKTGYTPIKGSFFFYHTTGGINIFRGTNLKYTANLVENTDLSGVTFTNKPAIIQQFRKCGANTNIAVTNQDYNVYFDANLIKDDKATLSLECDSANSKYMYAKINMGDKKPYMTITYKLITGLDNSYNMESFEADGINAYINNVTGYLTANIDLASVNNGDALPLKTSLIYNTYYNELLEEIGITKIFGNNFKLNFQQYIEEIENGMYYWIDADGSVNIFKQDNNNLSYYYSEDKNYILTKSTNGDAIFIDDVNYNRMTFYLGRLQEIYSQTNPKLGSILIKYDNINKGTITSIGYYPNNTKNPQYLIEFNYTDSKITKVKIKKESVNLNSYTLKYDSNNNLIMIYNDNAGNYNFNINYTNSNYLWDIINYKSSGLSFDYNRSTITKVKNVQGGIAGTLRVYDYADFIYNLRLTEINYNKDAAKMASKFVAFDNYRNVVSEWSENENGNVYVINNGEGNIEILDNITYVDSENYGAKAILNTSVDNFVLNSKETVNRNISLNNMLSNSEYYKYALLFKVRKITGTVLSFSVNYAGGQRDYCFSGVDTVYLILPCQFATSSVFTVKNKGDNSFEVFDISYNYVDYFKTRLRFTNNKTPDNNIVTINETETYTSEGIITTCKYDGNNRIINKTKREKSDTSFETTKYTYYSADGKQITNNYSSVITTKGGSEISREDYSYDASDRLTNKTTTKGALISRHTYTYDGDKITEKDENGVTTTTVYGISGGDRRIIEKSNGNITEKYEYNYFGEVTNVGVYDTASGNTVKMLEQTNNYNKGLYIGSSFGDNNYEIARDQTSMTQSVSHNGNVMIQYITAAPTGTNDYRALQSKIYANGTVENYSYGEMQNAVTYKQGEDGDVYATYKYNLDDKRRTTSSVYEKDGATELNYEYGDLNNKSQKTLEIAGNIDYTLLCSSNYNDKGGLHVADIRFKKDGEWKNIYTLSCNYNLKNQLTSITSKGTVFNMSYDAMGRLNNYIIKYNMEPVLNKTYNYDTYTDGGKTYTTNRLASIKDNINSSNLMSSNYNANGYISSVTYGGKTYNYTYDNAGRLISETYDGNTVRYTYNSFNTIYNKIVNGNITGYSYDSFGRITGYTEGGKAYFFAYDAMGNPVKYKTATTIEADNFVWTQGRKLASGNLNGNSFAYEYDPNGIRYKKTVDGKVTEYYLDGSRIIAENRIGGTGLIYYHYDNTGVVGMMYNGNTYYYERNTLGDIVRVINSTGATVANYSYDAWGNILTKSGSMADVNPFRYRGYYYDTETGFYYLQTRYYDPSIRMFINADNYDIIATLAEKVGQLNLYAYCNNNPVMYTDETGEFFWLALLITGLFVATLAGIDGGISAALSGGNFWIGFGAGFLGGAIGFIISAATGFSPTGSMLGRLASSAIYDIFNPLFQKGRIDKDDWLNLAIDLPMDLVFTGMYADLPIKSQFVSSMVTGLLDGGVDVFQQFFIYNNVTRVIQNQKQDNLSYINTTNDITKYYIVGA